MRCGPLLEAWRVEAAVAELPPGVAPAVHKLVTQLRDCERGHRAAQQRLWRQVWRWPVLAVGLPTAMAAWGLWVG